MYAEGGKHKRSEVAMLLAMSLHGPDLAQFGPRSEEDAYKDAIALEKSEGISLVKENIRLKQDEISSLSDIHPAWIAQALSNESPKIIGIILRWLPSKHVRYIIDHLPKKVKMSLPKLVESFAVPTDIVTIIKSKFEQKLALPIEKVPSKLAFDDLYLLKTDDMDVLFRDIGLQEVAMAFVNVESAGVRILLNRMLVRDARALSQRIKDVKDSSIALLKDAGYTVLESAIDQEDVEKLFLEVGIASFSKAFKDDKMFQRMQLKLSPAVAYLLRRNIDQHLSANKLTETRQKLILDRVEFLSKAGLLCQR